MKDHSRRSFVKTSAATGLTFTFAGLIRAHGQTGGGTTWNPETTFATTWATDVSTTWNQEVTYVATTWPGNETSTTWDPNSSYGETTHPFEEYSTTCDPNVTTVPEETTTMATTEVVYEYALQCVADPVTNGEVNARSWPLTDDGQHYTYGIEGANMPLDPSGFLNNIALKGALMANGPKKGDVAQSFQVDALMRSTVEQLPYITWYGGDVLHNTLARALSQRYSAIALISDSSPVTKTTPTPITQGSAYDAGNMAEAILKNSPSFVVIGGALFHNDTPNFGASAAYGGLGLTYAPSDKDYTCGDFQLTWEIIVVRRVKGTTNKYEPYIPE